MLTPLNGNNRIAYAERHGAETVPAFVTRRAWEGIIGGEAGGGRATEPVDAGATGAVDAGAAREGRAVHEPAAAGAGRASGENTDIAIPGEDRTIRARYEVWELGSLQPSHHGQTFLANDRYAHRNERDYSKPENQQRVIENSSEERFDPRYHITDNPDATNGPPLVDEDGNVIGGNNRTMIVQRVYGRGGRGAAGYRALLEQKAQQFGIDPAAVRGMKQPVLVRVASNADLESLPGGHQWAIRKTNVTGTAALSASERAAADARQMAPELVEHLAKSIEDAGPDATLNDALTGKSGTAIVNRLISEGFFSEQERPALMDGKTGALTQLAKDRISKALLGRFFRDSDQIARTPASIKNKLERIAAPLTKVQGNAEWDLAPAFREAIDLLEYAGAHGIKNLGDVVAQESMFPGGQQWHSDAIKLAEWLRDAKPNDLVAAVRRYVNDREPTMFGETTPADAFREHFGGEKAERAAGGGEPEREMGPHGPIEREFAGRPREALQWVREEKGGFAAGAIPHPAGAIGLPFGRPPDPISGREGYGVAHIDDPKYGHPGWLDEHIEDIAHWPVVEEIRNQQGRVVGRVLADGKGNRAVVSLDWKGQPHEEWLLTGYEKTKQPASRTSVGVPEAPQGAGPTPPATGASPGPASRGAAPTESGAPDSSVAREGAEVNRPPALGEEPEKPATGPIKEFLGDETGTSFVGAMLRADVEEMRALKAKRDAAIAELERAKETPEQMKVGQATLRSFLAERDVWGARVNQVIGRLRKMVPDHVEQEGLALMRDFKGKEEELARFLDGSHPAYQDLDKQNPLLRGTPGSEYAIARKRIEELRPAILKALNPTERMRKADAVLTKIAQATLDEGKRLGFLDSRWTADEYNPHILHPKGEGEYAEPLRLCATTSPALEAQAATEVRVPGAAPVRWSWPRIFR